MSEHDDIIERAVRALKEPVRIDPSFDLRVMSAIEQLPLPLPLPGEVSLVRSWFEWLRRPRTITLSPLGGLAGAAAVVAVVLLSGRMLAPGGEPAPVPSAAGIGTGRTTIQFVLVAPAATSVSVVGDFNDWNVTATPLARGQGEGDGLWSITIPLEPGHYRYSFLIDGDTWVKDPQAASAVEDEFGRANSILTIGGP